MKLNVLNLISPYLILSSCFYRHKYALNNSNLSNFSLWVDVFYIHHTLHFLQLSHVAIIKRLVSNLVAFYNSSSGSIVSCHNWISQLVLSQEIIFGLFFICALINTLAGTWIHSSPNTLQIKHNLYVIEPYFFKSMWLSFLVL